MRILILHNQVDPAAGADEADVLVQAQAVSEAAQHLGHDVQRRGCTLDLESLRRQLLANPPDLVFNLVESLGGTDRLQVLVPLLLEALSIPYTGCSAMAMLVVNDKLAAKTRFLAAGLPTPRWVTYSCHSGVERMTRSDSEGPCDFPPGSRWILKAVAEHASFGLSEEHVFAFTDENDLRRRLENRCAQTGRPHFAEEYIEGREFNLSLLADGCGATGARDRPRVLPAAEIDFSAFPAGRARIVGHAAKWAEDSREYRETPRHFRASSTDPVLVAQLSNLALRAWRYFDLRGFARIDFRVDSLDRPWILEINSNPCLSPDAGFQAALREAGIPFHDALAALIAFIPEP